MSGLVKPKKYDWKDSNLALFGSDTEKEVKKESAMSEPAWEGAGAEVGKQIWRINQFEVEHWPKEEYGKFYNGDSYIVLNTYKANEDSEDLDYDVHFWIGKYSTQDEYGTAAYKTVELDTFLDDKAVQHREVQGHESQMFLDYFDPQVIMEGGCATGFRHVTPEEYEPRLMHFNGKKKNITIKQVPLCASRLNSDDVFILDNGLQLYQWNGSGCNKDERWKAMEWVQDLKSERGNAELEVLEEDDTSKSHPFYEALTGEDEEDDDQVDEGGIKELYKVSDSDGSLDIEKIKDGDVTMDDLNSDDVFLIDVGNELFVWVGANASPTEKKNGLPYAMKHLANTSHDLAPVVVLKEGQRNSDFEAAMAA